MILPTFLGFTLLTLAACSSGQHNTFVVNTSQQSLKKDTTHLLDMASFVQKLSKKNLTLNNNYYKLTQNSDSTFRLTWGNDIIDRVYDRVIDFFVADRLEIAWDN